MATLPLEKNPGTNCTGESVGPQQVLQERKISWSSEFSKTGSLSQYTSHYTDVVPSQQMGYKNFSFSSMKHGLQQKRSWTSKNIFIRITKTCTVHQFWSIL